MSGNLVTRLELADQHVASSPAPALDQYRTLDLEVRVHQDEACGRHPVLGAVDLPRPHQPEQAVDFAVLVGYDGQLASISVPVGG